VSGSVSESESKHKRWDLDKTVHEGQPQYTVGIDPDPDSDPDTEGNREQTDRWAGGTGNCVAGGRRPRGFSLKGRTTTTGGLTFHWNSGHGNKWLYRGGPLVAVQHWQRVASATPRCRGRYRNRNRSTKDGIWTRPCMRANHNTQSESIPIPIPTPTPMGTGSRQIDGRVALASRCQCCAATRGVWTYFQHRANAPRSR
jgi:hypothetical protein